MKPSLHALQISSLMVNGQTLYHPHYVYQTEMTWDEISVVKNNNDINTFITKIITISGNIMPKI